MELGYCRRLGLVDKRVIGGAYGGSRFDSGELVYSEDFLHSEVVGDVSRGAWKMKI